jgi:hypothetical protein
MSTEEVSHVTPWLAHALLMAPTRTRDVESDDYRGPDRRIHPNGDGGWTPGAISKAVTQVGILGAIVLIGAWFAVNELPRIARLQEQTIAETRTTREVLREKIQQDERLAAQHERQTERLIGILLAT